MISECAFSILQTKILKACRKQQCNNLLCLRNSLFLWPRNLWERKRERIRERDTPWLTTAFKIKNSPRELYIYNDSFCKSDLFLPFDTSQWTDPQTFLHSKMKNLGDHIPRRTTARTHIKTHTYLEQSVYVIQFLYPQHRKNIWKRTHVHSLLFMYETKSHFSLFKMFLYKKVLKVTGQNSVDYRK